METIEVRKQDEIEDGWEFLVEIDDLKYSVTVDKDYWEKLAHSASSGSTPTELIKKSFEFLLAREPKESILREFNLKVISAYFPEYEKEIGKLL